MWGTLRFWARLDVLGTLRFWARLYVWGALRFWARRVEHTEILG